MAKTVTKYSKENIKKAINIIGWTLSEIFKLAPRDTTLLFVLSIFAAAVPILTAWISSRVLDELVKLIGREDLTLLSVINFNQPYFKFLLLSALIYLVQNLVRRSIRYLRQKFRVVHLDQQKENLSNHISKLDISKFEDSKVSNSILKANDNLWKIRDFVEVSIDFITELTSFLVSAVIVIKVYPLLGLFLIITNIPSGYVTLYFINKFYQFYDNNTENFRKIGWMNSSITSEYSVKQNRISGADNILSKKINELNNRLNVDEMRFRTKEYLQGILVSILDKLNDIIIPLTFIPKLLTGAFTIGDFSFYIGRANDISSRLDTIIGLLSSLFDDSLGIEKVKNVFEIKNNIISGNTEVASNIPPKIEFRNVSFKYPNSKDYAIKNLNIVINPQDEIAIVGENGAGKSTFIKLILRLYDITEGEILVNDVNIKDIKLDDYFKAIGVLFQDYSLYGFMSIEDNITIAAPKKRNEPDIYQSAIHAQAQDFIEKLPNKYKTLMSKSFTDGSNLSTGQEQKIALARMFYRNSPVLILDEPTASIDPVAEYHIFKKIYDFMTDKTVIIISHRFSTVRNAKKIYVFNNGKIIEQGSHSELMKINGVYADAFNKQAEGYTKVD